MAVTVRSRGCLHIGKCNSNELVLKIFYLIVFSCINCPVTAKYTSEEHIAK